jgi:hypothetical protein
MALGVKIFILRFRNISGQQERTRRKRMAVLKKAALAAV